MLPTGDELFGTTPDPNAQLASRVIQVEDPSGDPNAVGDSGLALGLGQMHPELRAKYGLTADSSAEDQRRAVTSEITELRQKHRNNEADALSEYHLGQTNYARDRYSPDNLKYLAQYGIGGSTPSAAKLPSGDEVFGSATKLPSGDEVFGPSATTTPPADTTPPTDTASATPGILTTLGEAADRYVPGVHGYVDLYRMVRGTPEDRAALLKEADEQAAHPYLTAAKTAGDLASVAGIPGAGGVTRAVLAGLPGAAGYTALRELGAGQEASAAGGDVVQGAAALGTAAKAITGAVRGQIGSGGAELLKETGELVPESAAGEAFPPVSRMTEAFEKAAKSPKAMQKVIDGGFTGAAAKFGRAARVQAIKSGAIQKALDAGWGPASKEVRAFDYGKFRDVFDDLPIHIHNLIGPDGEQALGQFFKYAGRQENVASGKGLFGLMAGPGSKFLTAYGGEELGRYYGTKLGKKLNEATGIPGAETVGKFGGAVVGGLLGYTKGDPANLAKMLADDTVRGMLLRAVRTADPQRVATLVGMIARESGRLGLDFSSPAEQGQREQPQ